MINHIWFRFRGHFLEKLIWFMHLLIHALLHPLKVKKLVFIGVVLEIFFKFLETTFHAVTFIIICTSFLIIWHWSCETHWWHHHRHGIHWCLHTIETHQLRPILLISSFEATVTFFILNIWLLLCLLVLLDLSGVLLNLRFLLKYFLILSFVFWIVNNIISDVIDIVCSITLMLAHRDRSHGG